MKRTMTLQELRAEHMRRLEEMSLERSINHPWARQLDVGLDAARYANYKILHPLLMTYKSPKRKVATEPMQFIGFDVETNAETGLPMLIGLSWDGTYVNLERPDIHALAEIIAEIRSNDRHTQFVCWGQLDQQAILHLFFPNESEQRMISRGISAVKRNGELISAPLARETDCGVLFISHYIPGRALRLGLACDGFIEEIWLFNCSQFYNSRIADAAKTLHLPWRDYARDTHIVNWSKYGSDVDYRSDVLDSNRQDAQTVCALAESLQNRFASVFGAYPSILVSAGSLVDAATAAMLEDDDYNSLSQKWLIDNVWSKSSDALTIALLQTLAAEAFSAGYIDQFAVGYFADVVTADISSAYPHKIRSLPDLRFSRLEISHDIDATLASLDGVAIFTAFIHGSVHIPPHLRYHPITIRTEARENYRPTGDFKAAYTLEEREWCLQYGARFEEEVGVFVVLTETKSSPLAVISRKLGSMRDDLLAELKKLDIDSIERVVLDGQQYLVKVVDNSQYGKTIMSVEKVQVIDGTPEITGYISGDRFNQIIGCVITARTRIQLADACMRVSVAGGRPIMCMTDALYWQGTPEMLPQELWKSVKLAGFFERPSVVHDFYILKTGQYEYQHDGRWEHKVRGALVDRDKLDHRKSFYRDLIQEYAHAHRESVSSEDVRITLPTNRLITVGRQNLERLGSIVESVTEIQPFVLGSKNVERRLDWRSCVDGHIWLQTPHAEFEVDLPPLDLMSALYLERVAEHKNKRSKHNWGARISKSQYILMLIERTGIQDVPKGRIAQMSKAYIDAFYGVNTDAVTS